MSDLTTFPSIPAPGEWLLSIYIATGMENVPIFIKADNVEDELEKFLKKL